MIRTDKLAISRFQNHVSFDTFASGEPTEKNTIAFTLNVKHKGYQFKRRSRTFMVGVGENEYSDIALQWMLGELVDDGDEIICVRVIDRDSKVVNDRNVEKRQYQIEAKELLQRIQIRNDDNRAIGIVLEFVAGKLHATFKRMIQLYEPAMLIVGTKGRSLGGLQGLVSNRNSFSKWCLQHSPIPVVVVRPTSKRMKKKIKRETAPTRHDYKRILKESGIEEHETDTCSQGIMREISYDLEIESSAEHTALDFTAGIESMLKPAYTNRKETSKANNLFGSERINISQEARAPNLFSSPIIIPQSDLDSPTADGEEDSIECCPKIFESTNDCDNSNSREPGQRINLKESFIDNKNTLKISLENYLPKKHSSPYPSSKFMNTSSDFHISSGSKNEIAEGSDLDESDFEIIPGKIVLGEIGANLYEEETDLEELELHEFLNIRETTFLAAQIARNLSADKYIFEDYETES